MQVKKHPYKSREYKLVPYDSSWVNQFEKYALQIRKIFGEDISVEHIGSTSVPGMVGKPCIDLLVMVNDLQVVKDHMGEMKEAGFEYAGEFVMEGSLLFRVVDDNTILANIHFFLKGHQHNKEMIDLRDYLRTHPEEIEKYSQLKQELYSKYSNDYALYRKYKDLYMRELKTRVKKSLEE